MSLQLVIGQWAVALASLFVRNKNTKAVSGGKKQGFGVTFADVSQTYHLLHQINMACESIFTLLLCLLADTIFN